MYKYKNIDLHVDHFLSVAHNSQQYCCFDESLFLLLLVDGKTLISKKFPVIGEYVMIIILTKEVAIAIV